MESKIHSTVFLKFSMALVFATASLFAGTANVQIWVKAAATGKAVNGATVVVLDGVDTTAAASSKAASSSPFQLTVPTTSVDGEKDGSKAPASFRTIQTHPNPCNESVTLTLPPSGAAGQGRLQVYNVLGRQVYSGPVETSAYAGSGYAVDMRMQNLAQGMYIVRMTDAAGKAVSGKFLKFGASIASASPVVWASGMRPIVWNGNRDGRPLGKSEAGTEYTFTAFTDRKSADADGNHVGGFASITVPISKDTTVTLDLEKVPFSECGHTLAPRSAAPVTVDGKADEPVWSQAKWGPMNQLWMLKMPTPEDFTGRYKMAWTPERLYVLAEIRDDSLSDQHSDALSSYYMDDCFEVFLDENASGGIHTYSYNAFAYHISIFGKAVDVGADQKTKDFTNHIEMKMAKNGSVYTWEISIKVFADTYNDKVTTNVPVTLSGGKVMGLATAYCDNDGHFDRESFMGSIYIAGKDKNTAWQDAGVFGTLELLP
jgi:hypothetical protein